MEPEEFRFKEDGAIPKLVGGTAETQHNEEKAESPTSLDRTPRRRQGKLLAIAAAILLLGAARIFKPTTTGQFEVAENQDGSSPYADTLVPTWLPIKATRSETDHTLNPPAFRGLLVDSDDREIEVWMTSVSDADWANPRLRAWTRDQALATATGRPGDPSFRVWIVALRDSPSPFGVDVPAWTEGLPQEALDGLLIEFANRCESTACGGYEAPQDGLLANLRLTAIEPRSLTTTRASRDDDEFAEVLVHTFETSGFVLPTTTPDLLGGEEEIGVFGGRLLSQHELQIGGHHALFQQTEEKAYLLIDRDDLEMTVVITGWSTDSSAGAKSTRSIWMPPDKDNTTLYGYTELTLRRIGESLKLLSGHEYGQQQQGLANQSVGGRIKVGGGSDWTAYAVTPRPRGDAHSKGCAVTLRIDPISPGNVSCEFDPCSEDKYLRGQRGSTRPLMGGRRIWCGMLDPSVNTVTFNFDDHTKIIVKPTLVAKGKAAVVVIELPAKAGSVEPRDAKGLLSSGEGIEPFTANARNAY